MELEYHDTAPRRRKTLIIVGVVLAIAAGAAAFFLISQAQQKPSQVAMRQVIVAARDIPARTALASSDLTLRQVPDDPALAQAPTDPKQVIGRVTAVSLLLQQPILPNFLLSGTAGSGFSILAPEETLAPNAPTWRAISINVPDDRAVGGAIKPDQRVDIFVTVQVNVMQPASGTGGQAARRNGFYTDKSTKVTYQDVTVLAKNGTFYVLKVDEKVAEEISHLQAAGNSSFSLALRPDGDRRKVDTANYGKTTNRIIREHGLPIPEIYPQP